MSVLDKALALADRYPVFACAEDKKPATKHGFKDATQDVRALRDMWRETGAPLIGIPTGSISGFDVLDIDPRHGGDDWFRDAEESLPDTKLVRTRSGGYHIFFKHADGVRNSASKIAPGVDTRGEGGYVIAWEAQGCDVRHPSALAEWPRGILKILCPPPVRKRHIPAPATKAEATTRAAIMIDRAFARVKSARPGERHYQLRAAASTLGGLQRFLTQSEDQLEQILVDLIMQTGAEDPVGAQRTARWALQKGSASPLLTGR